MQGKIELHTDPVVAGEHEVVGAGGAVPERVLGHDDVDVVGDELAEGTAAAVSGLYVNVTIWVTLNGRKKAWARSGSIVRTPPCPPCRSSSCSMKRPSMV